MTSNNQNPLIQFRDGPANSLPKFSAIQPSHILPAIKDTIKKSTKIRKEILNQNHYNYRDFLLPLFEGDEMLSKIWGVVNHLFSVKNSPELTEVYNKAQPLVNEYFTLAGQDELYKIKIAKMNEKLKKKELDVSLEIEKLIKDEYRDLKNAGAFLSDKKKKDFLQINRKLGELNTQFSNNVLLDTNEYELIVADLAELDGIPEDILNAAKEKATRDGHHGKFKFTLEMPSYLPFMQYCQNESLRKEFYQAYVTRATKGDRDNSPIIEEILFLRTKKAKLLGYKNYSEYSLASKMANNPKEVFSFLNELKKKSQIKIKRDITEIENYCQKNNITRGTAAWNRAWVTQKMELEMYQVDQEKIKEYFPEHKVLQGLFEIIHRLYQVKIAEKKQDSWHKDVRFFNLIQANKIIGSIFLDLYARPQKRSGAWMNDLLSRRQLKEGKQLPVAYVVCNFSSPTADKPALFTHDEVQTLFHEFGHALHHLLTQIDNPYFSGINGVPWDGVELPSQLFENWCWDRESLSMISAHYQTQEPLSKEIVDKIKKAKNFLSGIAMARQLEFSLLDMELHTRYQPKKKSNPPAFRALIVKIQNEISPFEIPNFSRFENAFLHIFAGGYAAGYYSYKWAEVLSADCFSRFNKEGLLNFKTAQDFYREILSIGGSKPFKEAFIAFMGRDPKIESLLINNGIMTA